MRYIDLEKVYDLLNDKFHVSPRDCEELLSEIPTEDVVPRADVEALEEERDKYKKYYFRHEYDKWEVEIKQEVAREIFQNIAYILKNYELYCKNFKTEFGELVVTDISCEIGELKKKYIGE